MTRARLSVSGAQLSRTPYDAKTLREFQARISSDHRRIVEAIAAGDSDGARAALRMHLGGSRDRLAARAPGLSSLSIDREHAGLSRPVRAAPRFSHGFADWRGTFEDWRAAGLGLLRAAVGDALDGEAMVEELGRAEAGAVRLRLRATLVWRAVTK